jgi:thiol:disulfide interchange protein DsbC
VFDVRPLAAIAIFALTASAQAADPDQVRESLQRHLGSATRITAVSKTPFNGIFEVVIDGRQIMYTDDGGQVLLNGPLLDVKNRVNITQDRMFDLRRIDFGALPLDKAIVKVKGTGARRIAVFSDPDCPYCKQLEPELEKLKDVTIYTFLFPIPSLHPDAMRKATIVWCADDRLRAWDDLMLRNTLPDDGKLGCATPILEIAQLARSLGIEGTPGLIFPNGRIVPGVLLAPEIEQRLRQPNS